MFKPNANHIPKINGAHRVAPDIPSKVEFFSSHIIPFHDTDICTKSLPILRERSSSHSPRDDPLIATNGIHKQPESTCTKYIKACKSDSPVIYNQILALLLSVSFTDLVESQLSSISIWKQLYNLLVPFQHSVNNQILNSCITIYVKEPFWKFLITFISKELDFLHISHRVSAFDDLFYENNHNSSPKDNNLIQLFTLHQLFQIKLTSDNDIRTLLSTVHTLGLLNSIDLFRILAIQFIHEVFYHDNLEAIDHYHKVFSFWIESFPPNLFQIEILFHLSTLVLYISAYSQSNPSCYESVTKFSSIFLQSISACWVHTHQWNVLPITWPRDYFVAKLFNTSKDKSATLCRLKYQSLRESLSIFQRHLMDDSSSWYPIISAYHSMTITNDIGIARIDTNTKKNTLQRTSPRQLAEYLTLIEWSRFYYLSEWVLIQGNIDDETLPMLHPKVYIQYLVDWFNRSSYSICYSVLSLDKLNDRVSMLRRWILTAEQCLIIGNYQTFFQIISSLSMGPLTRCQKTWAKLSRKHHSLYQSMLDVSSPLERYKKYRDSLKKSLELGLKTPILPFLGVFMSDLTFARDGNATLVQVNSDEKYHLMHNSCNNADFYIANDTFDDDVTRNSFCAHNTPNMYSTFGSVSEDELEASLPLRSHQSLIFRYLIHWKKFDILHNLTRDFIQAIHSRDGQLYPYYKQLSEGRDYLSVTTIPPDFDDIACYFQSNWNACSIEEDSLYYISYLIEPTHQ